MTAAAAAVTAVTIGSSTAVTAGSKRPPHHSTSGGWTESQGSTAAAWAIAFSNACRASATSSPTATP